MNTKPRGKQWDWTIAITVGSRGGFYFYRGYSTRLCLGWLAITIFRGDFDETLGQLSIAQNNNID